MPVFQQLVDLNLMFQQLSEPPIIINDLINIAEADREAIREMVTTRYSSDMISLMPSCRCGKTKGEFSNAVVCDYCGTPVKSSVENDIEPSVWFRKPNGVAPLMSPVVWTMLKNRFKKSGFSILQWLTDSTYNPSVKIPPVIAKLQAAGLKRGYNSFYEHFDAIMDFLFNLSEFKFPRTQVDYLQVLIAECRSSLFADHIPLPNKSILIIESSKLGKFVDNTVIKAVDAIEMITSIDSCFYDQTPRVKENRAAKAIDRLAEFHVLYNKNTLRPKEGQFRKHIFGTRTIFTFRAVITSITGTHRYDELEVPWAIGLTAFSPHLISKLMRLGMDLNSAKGMLLGHVAKYHPLLDQLLQELLEEATNGKITVTFLRNPSLPQGSIQCLGIGKFKTDPEDKTIGISDLIIKAPNADFDGDQMTATIALDSYLADKWYPLKPKFNILNMSRPYEVSGNIAIPKPHICAISNWLLAESDAMAT